LNGDVGLWSTQMISRSAPVWAPETTASKVQVAPLSTEVKE